MYFRNDPNINIEPEDFSEEADSTILVRTRPGDETRRSLQKGQRSRWPNRKHDHGPT